MTHLAARHHPILRPRKTHAMSRAAILIGLLLPASVASAAPPDTVDYQRHIRPILSDNCYACHGPDQEHLEAGLRLDLREGIVTETESGALPVVPESPEESELFLRISHEDPFMRMPPEDSGKQLSAEQIELIRKWIAQGAPWEEHWAFVPLERPEVPQVSRSEWVRNEVDAFILSRLESEGLEPAPPATKERLLRRVTLDLTGLPPTLQEIDAFLQDDSPQAYQRVVDRLLESPAYGEHRARYWLDAARYGDTHGLHLDNYREMWAYRDWVVKAYNDNLPYDKFLLYQLAGDLLPDPTLDQLIATGFLRCHVSTSEGGSIEEEVYVRNVVDRVVTTGTVIMGLTFDCTRCHDHKFDPLTMRDFYSMFAFFNSIDGGPLDGNVKDPAPVAKVATEEQQQTLTELQTQRDHLQESLDTHLKQFDYAEPNPEDVAVQAAPSTDGSESRKAYRSLAQWLADHQGSDDKSLPDDIRGLLKMAPEKRSGEQQEKLKTYFVRFVYADARDLFDPLNAKLEAVTNELGELDAKIPTTLIFRERSEPRPSFILHRGEYDQRREEVPRATPGFLLPLPEGAPLDRLGLGQWLLQPRHPLTSRVAVNRLWQQVFGIGLVKTSEDFGSQGEPPSHPELLDWLAAELVDSGWDVKGLLRTLVMSSTYQQTSKATPEVIARDPGNRLLARGPRYRLDAEMIRDQALAVSGLLVKKMGGPSVKPPQPLGLWFAVGYSGSNTVRFKKDDGPDKVHRRTVYTFIKRTAPPPQLSTFDAPSRESCQVRRERTNTPLQSLLLMNDPQFVEAARGLAQRALSQADWSPADRAQFMFRLCTGRAPRPDELQLLVESYEHHLSTYQSDPPAAGSLVAVGEIAPPSELDPVELAAWTMVANLVLNLDEVITKN
jgi:hypothetical protein